MSRDVALKALLLVSMIVAVGCRGQGPAVRVPAGRSQVSDVRVPEGKSQVGDVSVPEGKSRVNDDEPEAAAGDTAATPSD
jgi:hypothetical protein